MVRTVVVAYVLMSTVVAAQARADVRLRVVDPAGAAAPGVIVGCGGELAQANDSGVVAFDACAGPVWVRRGAGEPLAASLSGDAIVVPHQPTAIVEVLDATTGKPVASGTIRWATPGVPAALAESAWRAADGRLALLTTPPASVTIESPGYRSASVELLRAGSAGRAVLLVPEVALDLELTPPSSGRVCYAVQSRLGPSVKFRAVATCQPLDPKGTTHLDALTRGARYVGLLLPEGAAPKLISFTAGQTPVKMRLEPGSTVAARVVDPADQPIAGATVKIAGSLTALERYPWTQEATSGDDGGVRIAGAVPGAIVATVTAPGKGSRRIEVEVGEAPAHDLGRIVLEPALVMQGQVVDAGTKAAIAGASIACGSVAATTDGKGGFVLDGLAAGEIEGTAVAEGYVELGWKAAVPAGPQMLALERSAVIVWPLETGAAPPASVAASWSRDLPKTRADLGDGRWSEADGAVTFSGMGPGKYELEARAAGYVAARAEVEVHTAGETLTLPVTRLESGMGFLGAVVTRDGEPVAGAEVAAEPGSPDVYRPPRDVERAARATTDTEGRFALFGLAEGPYRVVVRAPGMARTVVDGATPEDQGNDLGTITVGEGFAVTGRVLRRDRAPLANTVVEVREGKSYEYTPIAQSRTDEQGAFAFAGVPAGRWLLRVRVGGRDVTAAVEGSDGDEVKQDVTVGGLRVTGQVLLGEQPPSGGTLTWTQGEEKPRGVVVIFDRGDGDKEIFGVQRPASAAVQHDGSFALDGVNPGEYTVRLVTGLNSTPTRAVLPDTEQHFVTLRFPGGTLAGRVVDEDGAGVRFAQVQAARAGGAPLSQAVSEESGEFRLAGLPKERLLLKAQAREFEPGEAVEVEIGQTSEPVIITLKKASGGTVTGTLASSHGLVAGAPVALFGPTPGLAYARQDGSFEFKALTAGSYRVCARPLGGACGCGLQVQVTDRETVATNIAIGEGGWIEVETSEELADARPLVATLEGQDVTSLLFLGNPWQSGGGIIRFGPLAAGAYRVELSGAKRSVPLTVRVAAGKTTRVVSP